MYLNRFFVAYFSDNLQRNIAFTSDLKTLPTADLVVLAAFENLLVNFFLIHKPTFVLFACGISHHLKCPKF
jgi:hypothetical protein